MEQLLRSYLGKAVRLILDGGGVMEGNIDDITTDGIILLHRQNIAKGPAGYDDRKYVRSITHGRTLVEMVRGIEMEEKPNDDGHTDSELGS